MLVVALVAASLSLPVLASVPPAQAVGTPDIQVSKAVDASTLYGDKVSVTLTATNPAGPAGYNLTFTDVIPVGTTFGTSNYGTPDQQIALPDGTTELVWLNVADLQQGTSVPLTYTYTYPDTYNVGASFTGTAGAYVNSSPRTVPKVNPTTGAPIATSYTGSATDSATTKLVPFEVTKTEPSPESELLRGVHDHKTVYTVTVKNNDVNPTTNFGIVDYLPAGLEYLGCTAVDNSTPGTVEYTGAGRIDATPNPTMTDCVNATSVTTVTTDPDGSGPLPNAVYTRVEWTGLGTVAPGQSLTLQYAAAIPMRENVAYSGNSTANLDNNTGALTTDEQQLTNIATATGDYQGTSYSASGTKTVSAEDVAIQKTVDNPAITQGQTSTWTMHIESSEYALSTDPIVVTDSIPDGLDFDSATPAPDSTPAVQSDYTLAAKWTLPAFTANNSTATITYTTTTRTDYRKPGAGGTVEPVSAQDSWTNNVALATNSTVRDDNADGTNVVSTPDASSASQQAGPVALDKEVSTSSTTGASCPTDTADYVKNASGYHPGDNVCYRITATFPTDLNTVGNTIQDFLPAGFTYQSYAFTPSSTITGSDTTFTAAGDNASMTWKIDNAATGALFQVVVKAKITSISTITDQDISANLAKMTYNNSAGKVFQLRDNADATLDVPEVALDKGIATLNGVAVTGAPAPSVTAQAGDVVGYRVTVTNSGHQAAINASARDLIPTQFDCSAVSTISNAGTCASGQINWTGLTIPAQSSLTLTYSITLPAGVSPSDTFTNHAGVVTYQGVANDGTDFTYVPANNIAGAAAGTPNTTAADDTAVVNVAAPTVTKTVDKPTATIGEIVTYTVTATIPQGTTLYNTPTITDTLPANLVLAGTATATIAGAPATVTTNGQVVSVALGGASYTNAPGSGADSVVITIPARVVDTSANLRGTVISNTATLAWQNATGTNRTAAAQTPATTTVTEPQLTETKTSDATGGKVTPGQTLTYTLKTGNTGTSTGFDTIVTDVVPVDLTPVLPITGGSYDSASRIITFGPFNVATGATVTNTYQATVANPLVSSNSITNNVTATTTSLSGSDANERTATSSSNSGYTAKSSVTLTAPDLSVAKTNTTPGAKTIGDSSTYQLAVTIPAGTLAYDATVLDTLPAGEQFGSFVSSSCDQGGSACSPAVTASVLGTPAPTDTTIGFFLGDLAPASSATRIVTITYTAIIEAPAASGDTLTNTALVGYDSTNKTDPTTVPTAASFDNRTPIASAQQPVVEPKLTIAKDVFDAAGDPVTRAIPGETLTYKLAVTNTGTSSAYDVHVTDTPDRRLTDFTAVSGGTVTDGDPSDGTLAWTIPGPIAAGTTSTVTYTLTVPASLTEQSAIGVQNTAGVSSYDGVPLASQVPSRTYKTYTDVTPASANVNLDVASIGDRVWLDTNGNGLQDIGEPGLAGVTVRVTYSGADGVFGTPDDEVHTTTTDANGDWQVKDLPGTTATTSYRVQVDPSTLPAGLVPSYDLDGTSSPNVWNGSLGANEAKTDVDFGYTGSGSVGNLVWYDQNANGTQDPGEPGLAGAHVQLTWAGPDGDPSTTGDNVVYTATTDADGAYSIDHLPAGNYSVLVNGQPAGYNPVSGPNGASATNDFALAAGQARTDQNFGFAGTGSIGDYVWLDKNGDGVQDPSELPIVGATLQLTWYGPDGVAGGGDDATFTTSTDAQGKYLFDHLLPGTYVVAVTGALPDAVTNSFDEDGNHDSMTTVTLGNDEQHLTADFGYHASSIIGDRVWWDVNKDGVQDPTEPGLPGVGITVTYAGADGIFGNSDDLTFTTTTDSDGDWAVTNVPQGNYRVAVTSGVPTGFTADYDADGTANGLGTSALTLDATHVADLNQDFGYSGDLSIGDTVWLDQNGDGVQNAGEPGLPGVGVTLDWYGPDGVKGGGDDVTFQTTTDADGHYSFDGLPGGDYSVTIDPSTFPAGVTASYDLDGGRDNTTQVTLTNADVTNADFGLRGTGTIGDLVWLDRNGDGVLDPGEKGLGGVKVTATWAGPDGLIGTADDASFATTTAADGSYSIEGLPAGPYSVAVDPATVPAGLRLTHNENGGATAVDTFSLAAGATHDTANFAYAGSGSIGDTVYLDANGNGTQDPGEKGVPDQPVTLLWAGPDGILGNGDDQTFTTTTDASGNYLFGNLPDGAFRVTVDGGIASRATNTGDPDGGTPNSADVTLTGGQSDLTQDFGYQGSNAIGDTVWWDRNGDGKDQSNEPPLAGVTVDVTWFGPDGVAGGGDDVTYTAVTDADGKYLVSDLPDGAYGVKVVSGVPAGLSPSYDASGAVDGASTVTVTGGETNLDQDFGFSATGTIGDTVWLDSNGDGTKGPGEAGIPDVTVTLTWAGPDGVFGTADDEVMTTTTDKNGHYEFDRLAAGDFTVALTGLPQGITPTFDPDKGVPNQSALTLASGEKNLDQDFGYRGSATVGDTIWLDVDGNGKQGPHEPGLPGITVTARLGGADGVVGTADDVIVTTTTDKNGHYRFTGLPPGPAVISYNTATLPKGDVPESDLDGGNLSSTSLTLTSGETKLDVDFVVKGTSSLHGLVFDDKNGNGKQDPGENGIGGVTVVITYDGPDGPVVITTKTAADGTWSVKNLPAGSYTVTVDPSTVPAGLHATTETSSKILLTPGASGEVEVGVDSAASALAFTGSDITWTLFIGIVFLGAGGAAFVISRRPRRKGRLS